MAHTLPGNIPLLRLTRLFLKISPAAAAEKALFYNDGDEESDEERKKDSQNLEQDHVVSILLGFTPTPRRQEVEQSGSVDFRF